MDKFLCPLMGKNSFFLINKMKFFYIKKTLKTASKNDMWLHTKDIHGSHVIVVSDGKEISDTAIYEAARLAAYHSKARNSSQVPVDCTLVRYVSKPNGSKPGMVIYVNNKTLYVKPSQTVE